MALQAHEHAAAAMGGAGVEKSGKEGGSLCSWTSGDPGDIGGGGTSLRASQVPRHCSSKAHPPRADGAQGPELG